MPLMLLGLDLPVAHERLAAREFNQLVL